MEQALEVALAREGRRLVCLRGQPGSGRDTALRALLGRVRTTGYVRTPSQLVRGAPALEPELSGSVPVWDARECDASPDDRARGGEWVARGGDVAIALLDVDQETPPARDRSTFIVELSPVDRDERLWAWREALGGTSDAVANRLASELHVGPGLARRAAAAASAPQVRELRASVLDLVPPSTARGIRVEHPSVKIADLVLQPRVFGALEEVLCLLRHENAVRSPYRSGVKALFSGPPGSGKTLAARAIAGETERPLFRVDLANVVSKWLGETEKNLDRAFRAAAVAGAVLLFDEGDALFGERGEVSRGSDRYANMEVGYLLQAIEVYDGVVVVTTNARSRIDGAFLRRFDTAIEFGKPLEAERLELWLRELGGEAASLEPKFLASIAKRAELTGGHIAAAARLARVLARSADRPLAEEDLLAAIAAEYEKLGGTLTANHWRDERAKAGTWHRPG